MVKFENPVRLNRFIAKLTAALNQIWPTIFDSRIEYQDRIKISLIGAASMKKQNLRYRGIDRPTDVLSFPLYQNMNELPAGNADLGDILICEQLCNTKHLSVTDSVVHGTLHLLGFDHETDQPEWNKILKLITSKI